MQFTERCKKIPWKGIGEGLGALFTISTIVSAPFIIAHIYSIRMSKLPTHYASAIITEQKFVSGFIPGLFPVQTYISVKSAELPFKEGVLLVSHKQYAALSVGDKVCVSYKTVPDFNPQDNLDIAPLESCTK